MKGEISFRNDSLTLKHSFCRLFLARLCTASLPPSTQIELDCKIFFFYRWLGGRKKCAVNDDGVLLESQGVGGQRGWDFTLDASWRESC